jgi:hypothetical protein
MSETEVPGEAAGFRLLRVITIDSYARGGETVLNVDGGTIITGENGVGKTSLIRLIPVFFGELPRRISVGTQSFGDFYLARTTSYIVFEYVRRGVVCQSVLYAGDADESYLYRFVRAPYDLRLYTEEDGKSIVAGNALTTHLKKIGIDHSRALSHDVYRAVIQGRAHAGRDASFHRALVADYAFTPSNNRLDHIDRIVSGMFQRKAEFRDFLRMVVSYISDRDEEIAITGDRGRIAVWPLQYAAYQDVMQMATKMDDVERQDAEMTAQKRTFSVLHAKTLVLIDYATSQEERLRDLYAEAEAKLSEAADKRATEDQSLATQEATEKGEADALVERVDRLDSRKTEYEQDGMPVKADLVDGIERLIQRAKDAEDRRKILVGAKVEIDERYTRLKNQATRDHNDRHAAALKERSKVDAQFAEFLKNLEGEREAVLQALADEHRGRIDEATEAAARAREAAGRAEQASENPVPDPERVQHWKGKRTTAENARAALSGPKQKLDAAQRAATAAKDAFEHEDDVAQKIVQRIDVLTGNIERLEAHSNPDPGSFLAYLRRERPDWHKDIAKVVDEALLSRTDLDPAVLEASAGLFGITVDLSRLESNLAADESLLREEILALESQRSERRTDLDAGKARLQKASDALSATVEARREAEVALQNAEAAATSADNEERTSRHAMEQSQRDAKAVADQQASDARVKAASAQQGLATARAAQSTEERAKKAAFQARRHDIESQRRDRLRTTDAAMDTDRLQTEATLKAYDAECAAALAQEGVDVEALAGIDKELAGINEQLGKARAAIRQVAEWQAWLKDEWSQRDDLVRKAAAAKEKYGKTKKRREDKALAWEAQRKAAQANLDRLEHQAKAAENAAADARQLIVRSLLSDHPADPETRGSAYDSAWTYDSLSAQTADAFRKHGVTRARLKTRIEEIKRAFRGGEGTPTEDYFHTTASEADPDDDDPYAWVAPLRAWYGGRHEEYLRPLLVEARKFGEMVIGFQRDVTRFGREIARFNRDMQDALNQTVVFRRISSVEITFASTITEKRYWQPINDFIRDHESWIHGTSHDLPPAAFASDLDRLLEHWDVREGIRAERLSLIDVSGKVVENGVEKRFRDSATLAALSSNGLSYLILIVIFVAFLRKIRGDADIFVTYAVDELGDLDRKNIGVLVEMLRKNGIFLVSACPDADVDVLIQFPNRYEVTRDSAGPELVAVDLDVWEPDHV